LIDVEMCVQLNVDVRPAVLAVACLRHDVLRLCDYRHHVVVDAGTSSLVVVVVGRHSGTRVQRRVSEPLRLVVLAAAQHQVGQRPVGRRRGRVPLAEDSHPHCQRRSHGFDRLVQTAAIHHGVAEPRQSRRRARVVAVATHRRVGGAAGGRRGSLEQRQTVPDRSTTAQAVHRQRVSRQLVANDAVRQIVTVVTPAPRVKAANRQIYSLKSDRATVHAIVTSSERLLSLVPLATHLWKVA